MCSNYENQELQAADDMRRAHERLKKVLDEKGMKYEVRDDCIVIDTREIDYTGLELQLLRQMSSNVELRRAPLIVPKDIEVMFPDEVPNIEKMLADGLILKAKDLPVAPMPQRPKFRPPTAKRRRHR